MEGYFILSFLLVLKHYPWIRFHLKQCYHRLNFFGLKEYYHFMIRLIDLDLQSLIFHVLLRDLICLGFLFCLSL